MSSPAPCHWVDSRAALRRANLNANLNMNANLNAKLNAKLNEKRPGRGSFLKVSVAGNSDPARAVVSGISDY